MAVSQYRKYVCSYVQGPPALCRASKVSLLVCSRMCCSLKKNPSVELLNRKHTNTSTDTNTIAETLKFQIKMTHCSLVFCCLLYSFIHNNVHEETNAEGITSHDKKLPISQDVQYNDNDS